MMEFFDGIVNRISEKQAGIKPRPPSLFETRAPSRASGFSRPNAVSGIHLQTRSNLVEATETFQEQMRWRGPTEGRYKDKNTDSSTGEGISGPAWNDEHQASKIQIHPSGPQEFTATRGYSSTSEVETTPFSEDDNGQSETANDFSRSLFGSIDHNKPEKASIRHRPVKEGGGELNPVQPATPGMLAALPSQVIADARNPMSGSRNDVVVRIGRLEVRAVKPPAKPRSKRKDAGVQPMGLDEYARRREDRNR